MAEPNGASNGVDVWTQRVVVFGLVGLSALSIVAITMLAIRGQKIPDVLGATATTAMGALAVMFSTKIGKNGSA